MVPFDVSLETIARFLNCEIADHPVYDGLEVQWFDDPRHGRGMLAFLTRRDDGRADFYYQPTLTLDPATFYVGAGIGRWGPAEFHAARLELSSEGVLAEVRFDDAEGRSIALHVDDRGGSPRRRCRLLAPVSAAIAAPPSMMLVYLRGVDLVQARGTCRVAIGGQDVSTGRLPLPWLHGRRLVKVSDGRGPGSTHARGGPRCSPLSRWGAPRRRPEPSRHPSGPSLRARPPGSRWR